MSKDSSLRARSVPSSRPFNIAAVLSALHYLGLITTLTAFILVFTEHGELATQCMLAGIGMSAMIWVIAFFKRRSALCPLCRGTPLLNSGAFTHSKASRIYPLNHGVSATLSIIVTQSFRCMYCGSDFDLLKTPAHRRNKEVGN
jgi:hypothetical protein